MRKKKTIDKDIIYKAIRDFMDETFEYRKEFKQKYLGKAGGQGTRKDIERSVEDRNDRK